MTYNLYSVIINVLTLVLFVLAVINLQYQISKISKKIDELLKKHE